MVLRMFLYGSPLRHTVDRRKIILTFERDMSMSITTDSSKFAFLVEFEKILAGKFFGVSIATHI